MQFDDVRTFVAVAEARSVSRAARDLHLTQPAVTRRVQRLESSLGVTLCDRRRRPFTLTPAGRAALERCAACCGRCARCSPPPGTTATLRARSGSGSPTPSPR